ncbi:MAG TPA: TlpA disulfide reductase family protein [Bryobacteraceae bacterium]|nr:TlpA disulfide reductase family protein [Bryobacteraceae bacterium]
MLILRLGVLALSSSVFLAAQDNSALAAAKALDQEILKLNTLPQDARPQVIHDLAARVRQQPARYIAALAFNLSEDIGEADGREALQDVANTMVEAIRRSPQSKLPGNMYTNLASLARYGHVHVALDDPKYTAAISQLDADDRQRAGGAFALQDLRGRTWDLKKLRGKVVLVNFWATWCPPCREEMPDLEDLYQRFRGQGLLVLAISGDQPSDLRKFLAQQKLSFPLLIDPDNKTMKQFRVTGIPKTFLYDRQGHLAGQTLDRPNMSEWIALLHLAGLK